MAVLSRLRTGFTRSVDRTWYSLSLTDPITTRSQAASYLQLGGEIYAPILAMIFTVAL
jgi:hypothetical protein